MKASLKRHYLLKCDPFVFLKNIAHFLKNIVIWAFQCVWKFRVACMILQLFCFAGGSVTKSQCDLMGLS